MSSARNFHVIYLTGAAATGKSTMARALANRISPLKVYHYSDLLISHLAKQRSVHLLTDDLRSQSGSIVTPGDVEQVDRQLIEDTRGAREHSHVLIDSHAVTKEEYGYRVTPFSLDKLRELLPTVICALYAEPEEITRRIANDAGGRPMISRFQIEIGSLLQAQVALHYSLDLGLPAYFFDTSESIAAGLAKLLAILNR
jgi:adenylate kinase